MPKTAQSVLTHLAKLDKQFSKQPNQRLELFNHAYYIVTDNISYAAQQGYFHNLELIETFSRRFADYYFDAVSFFVANDSKLPPAWAKLNTINDQTPHFIALLLGANAHINHDLPLALNDVMKGQATDDLLEDIIRIDELLKASGRQILNEFDEPNRHLNWVKQHLRFIYFFPVMHLIFWWRIRAWRNYRRLKKGRPAKPYSLKVADYLLRLGGWLSRV